MLKKVPWFEALAWCFRGKGVVRSPSGREFCYSPAGDFWTRSSVDGPWTNMYHTKAMLELDDSDWELLGESYPKVPETRESRLLGVLKRDIEYYEKNEDKYDALMLARRIYESLKE